MTAQQIVATLEQKGCALWLEGGKVKFHDPQGVMTTQVLQVLQKGREKVVAVIEGKSRPHLLHAPGVVADPDLIEAGRLADLEHDLFVKGLRYTFGQRTPGDWVTEQSVIQAMYPADADEIVELLSGLEAAGRALCLRRYPAQRLWRAVNVAIFEEQVSGTGEMYDPFEVAA